MIVFMYAIMKKISAYLRGQSYEAEVDDEDFEFLSQYKWTAKISSRTVYAQTNVESPRGFVNVQMHRMVIGDAADAIEEESIPYEEVPLSNGKTVFIVSRGYERFRKKTVDHIDGNGLNNCRTNLRHLTCREQANNRRF